ncbi:MAG TPA: tripartite tricarboxylate transporter substrate binding protein [Burkholderiales bacterium]|nr:tripartite tricarboxylate transporter substrate binding protein [Burkholderiales bacterium]
MGSLCNELRRGRAFLALVITCSGLTGACVTNAAYPERPIRYVLPSAAGGGPDVAARVVMAELARQLGRQVVVDNRPGGSGTIGTEAIARASPDGYTIGHGNINTMAINRSVLPKLTYDLDHDLRPVVHMYGTPNLLAVTLSLPVKSVQELVDYAKKNPNALLFASTGNGSSVHVGVELLKLMTNTQMVHVPFKAATVALADLTAGRVHLMADNINSIGPHVKAGRLRGLGVTSAKRVPAFADLPTIAEAGVPGFDVSAWAGVIVPAGVSKTIITRLNAEVNKALAAPAVRDKLPELGLIVVGGTPDEFQAHIRKETARWADVVKRAGVKVD